MKSIYPPNRLFFILICLTFFWTANSQTVTLDLNPGLMIPEDCQTITAGTAINFERGMLCDAEVRIEKDGDPIAVLSTPDLTFSYLFAEPGEYIIFCGADAPPDAEIAITTACFTVTNNVVPTLGEWSIIILFLLISIFAISALKSLPRFSVR